VADTDLIDITAVNSDVFSLNHDIYANSPAVIGDLKRLLKEGRRPPDARTIELEKVPGRRRRVLALSGARLEAVRVTFNMLFGVQRDCVLKNTICRIFRFDVVLLLARAGSLRHRSDSGRNQRDLLRRLFRLLRRGPRRPIEPASAYGKPLLERVPLYGEASNAHRCPASGADLSSFSGLSTLRYPSTVCVTIAWPPTNSLII
jgi:hypothetical protein